MPSFKDTEQRSWDVRFSINQQRKTRSRCGVSVTRLLTEETLRELYADEDKMLDLLWSVVEDQATTRNLDADAFFSAMDADTLEAAFDAIFDAAIESLPQKKRPAAEKVLRILRRTGSNAIDQATTKIQDLDEETTVREISDQIAALLSPTKNTTPGSSN